MKDDYEGFLRNGFGDGCSKGTTDQRPPDLVGDGYHGF